MRPAASTRTGITADDLPSPRCWRRSELAILDALYPVGGIRAVAPHLPHRSRQTIRQTAWKRGLRVRKG